MNTKGIGLGLYISKMIVENFGGDISLQSVKNVGSTFTFVIAVEKLSMEEIAGESRCRNPLAQKIP